MRRHSLFLLLFIFLLFLPSRGNANFERVIKYELYKKWLPQIGNSSLEKRFEATRALLVFADWSLPIVREAYKNPQYEAIRWRLAFLLGVIGQQKDIALLLRYSPQSEFVFQKKVWEGALERLFWRYRVPTTSQLLISHLSFTPIDVSSRQQHNNMSDVISGPLLYKIVNPDSESILIHTYLHVLRAQLSNPLSLHYHWILPGQSIEILFPLDLFPPVDAESIRIDFKIDEVGVYDSIANYKIIIPLNDSNSKN